MADDLLERSLDIHFKHSRWHFLKRDIEHAMKKSLVLSRLKQAKPILPFTGMFYYKSIFIFIYFPFFSAGACNSDLTLSILFYFFSLLTLYLLTYMLFPINLLRNRDRLKKEKELDAVDNIEYLCCYICIMSIKKKSEKVWLPPLWAKAFKDNI